MKTKDFIKMLQEEDPSGECYVRINGGAIYWCESKEGYWDGAYEYYDKENKTWHTSSKDYKIDVHTISWDDIIWEEEGDMDKIKTRLKPDYSNYVRKEEYETNFWKKVEKEAIDAKTFFDKLQKEMYDRVMERFNSGYTFWTLNNSKLMIYNGAKWKKKLKRDSAVSGEMQIIQKNPDLFEKQIKGKYLIYKLKK